MQTELVDRLDRLSTEASEKDRFTITIIYDLVNAHIALSALTRDNPNPRETPGLIHVVAILTKHQQHPMGVSVSLAARLLEVSERTVRKWLASGLLRAVPKSKPLKVADSSLSRVLALVSEIREDSNPRHLAEEVAARIDDARLVKELLEAPSDKTEFVRVGDPSEIWADVD